MNHSQRQATWLRLLLLFILPLALLFLTPGGAMVSGHVMWFWLTMLLSIWMIWLFIGRPADDDQAMKPPKPSDLLPSDWPEAVESVMDVRVAQTEGGVRVFRGALKIDAENAIGHLQAAVPQTSALIQQDDEYGAAVSRAGQTISTVSLWSMFLLALFVWPGLFLWVILIFFIAGRGMPPLNDITPISLARRWVGYATFVILLAILLPVPHALWGELGIHCPYM